jgi:hypothetical protein
MSFAKLSYDNCAYTTDLKESLKPGEYMLNTPKNDCDSNTFFDSPYIRLGKTGVATCKNKELVDVHSELLGLNMKAVKCPEKRSFDSDYCDNKQLQIENNTFMDSEDTKMSNPPCTLRGTGWNRWEWLHTDPQEKAIVPFNINMDNRIIVKDNHRPCVPTLSDKDASLPEAFGDDSCYTDKEAFMLYKETESTPFIHWRSCDEIRKY